jgi:hypothetical protein
MTHNNPTTVSRGRQIATAILAAPLFAAALAVGTAVLAHAEDGLDERGYADCLQRYVEDPDSPTGMIKTCCITNGGEVVYDGDWPIDCVPPITIEDERQPQPPSTVPSPGKVDQPVLAPPSAPTKTPLITPAPNPVLAPR